MWWFPTTSDVYKVVLTIQQRVEVLHQTMYRHEMELDMLRSDLVDLINVGVAKMSRELDDLRALAEQIDQKGDAILALLQETTDKLNELLNSSLELAELKAGVAEVNVKLQEQLGQFEAKLP